MEEIKNSAMKGFDKLKKQAAKELPEIPEEIKQCNDINEIQNSISYLSYMIPLQESAMRDQKYRLDNWPMSEETKRFCSKILNDSEKAYEQTKNLLQSLKTRLAELQNQPNIAPPLNQNHEQGAL